MLPTTTFSFLFLLTKEMITTLADAQTQGLLLLQQQGISLLPEEQEAFKDSLSFAFQTKILEQLTPQQ